MIDSEAKEMLGCRSCRPSELADPYRLSLLQTAGLLDTPPEESFDRYTRLAQRLLGAPTVVVSIVDHRRQFFKSHQGLSEPLSEERETPLSHSFCQHVVNRGLPLIVEDARLHELLKDNLAIPDLNAIAYAGFPIIAEEWVLGSFCALYGEPYSWKPEELTALNDLAAAVSTEVELRLNAARHQQAADLVKVALDQALAANQARAGFQASASHELRTPLNAIIGFSEMLSAETYGPVNPKQARYLDNILASSRHLLSLINDLLDVSCVDSQGFALEIQAVDLIQIVAQVVEELSPLAQVASIGLEYESGARSLAVAADPKRLRQILHNLVHNSIKFTDQGSVTVTVAAKAVEAEICVKDTGVGLPANREFLFEPFKRSELTGDRLGTGLGLPLVRTLVELHGGRIWAQSDGPGQGSEFIFTLPLSNYGRTA